MLVVAVRLRESAHGANRRHEVALQSFSPAVHDGSSRTVGEVHGADDRTHTGAGDGAHGQSLLVENLKHAKVRETSRAPTSQRQHWRPKPPRQTAEH
jgi:hypothetical protein